MAWWQYGIKGRTDSIVKSGSINEPITGIKNLVSFNSSGSYSLNPNPDASAEYPILLCTTEGGTQVFLVLKPTLVTGQTAYFPNETVNIWDYYGHIRLRRNGTTWETTAGNTGNGFKIIAGNASIYEYCYRCIGPAGLYDDAGKVWNPGFAYPRSKSGGTSGQIGCINTNDGIDFYAVGFSCVTHSDFVYNAPCFFVGRIPASILDNLFWFDPNVDALSEDGFNQIISGGGGIVPGDRPIDYDYEGDDIDFPDLPTGASAIGFGRMKIYKPNASQLANALDILWSDSTESTLETIIESCKKWWYKPEQYCVSLNLMPLDVNGTAARIYFGKYNTQTDAAAIDSQYVIVDCGTITVPLKSGSCFDYGEYVNCMLYLPYVGFRQINTNEVMGGDIAIKYYVDMFTGVSLCMVKVSNSNSNSGIMYSYECNIAQQIPITSENYNTVINSMIATSLSVVSQNYGAAAANWAQVGASMGSPSLQTSGKLNSNAGALGYNKPYLVLHFPVQSLPNGFESQEGFPTSVNIQLSNLTGYVEVEKIHLDISGAYDEDLTEIDRLLKEGVIL